MLCLPFSIRSLISLFLFSFFRVAGDGAQVVRQYAGFINEHLWRVETNKQPQGKLFYHVFHKVRRPQVTCTGQPILFCLFFA